MNNSETTPDIIQTRTSQLLDVDVEIIDPKRKTKPARKPNTNQENSHRTADIGANIVNADENEQNIEEIQLKYGASHVIKLFLPVTLCILFVIISLTLITSYQKSGGANL
jgi:hypothetical protein